MQEEMPVEAPKTPVKRQKKVDPCVGMAEEIKRLEACLSKLAVMTGQGNMLHQFGIERWVPSKDDLKRKW